MIVHTTSYIQIALRKRGSCLENGFCRWDNAFGAKESRKTPHTHNPVSIKGCSPHPLQEGKGGAGALEITKPSRGNCFLRSQLPLNHT